MGGQSWNLKNCLLSFFRLCGFFLQTFCHLATLPGQPGPDQDLGHTEFLPLQVLHLLVAAFRLEKGIRNIITAQNYVKLSCLGGDHAP